MPSATARTTRSGTPTASAPKNSEDHAGLYYFGARYYDPEIGRWLTPDPLGFIDGPNKYLYVADNPLNLLTRGGYWERGSYRH